MPRLIDDVVQNLRHFIDITHCNGKDRGHIGKFDDSLTWLEQSQLRTEPLLRCLDGLEPGGGTRLYDSICDAVDHMCTCGDRSHPWLVFVVAHSNDSVSQRDAGACRRHLLASNGRGYLSVILISVGSAIRTDELDNIAAGTCMRRIHAKSVKKLEDTLVWGASINSTGGLQSAMDYAIIVDTSACTGAQAPVQPKHRLPPRYPRAATPGPVAATNIQSGSSLPPSNQQPVAAQGAPPAAEGQVPAGLLLAARAYESSLHEESVLESARRQASETTKRSSPDVRIREFYNGLLHPGDKQIFREFALKNYSRNLLTQWEEEEVEYLVMVEQDRGAIVGLLVMVPYDINAVHIRLMVVDGDHRKRGLGTQMLMHVAAKHASKKVTLNVDFDRPELLGFYVLKGYARLEDVSMEHRVMMLALNHAGLIARIPLPDLP